MVTTMFGLSPIGPSLVPRLHGIETNEPGSRESKPPPSTRERRAMDAVDALGCLARAPRERAGTERDTARRGFDASVQNTGSRRSDTPSPPFRVCRRPTGASSDSFHPTPVERWLTRSPTGRTSGEVPEVTGGRIFENIFFKNNDLRNLWFRARHRATRLPPSGSPAIGARRGSNQLYGARHG
jgi:hypothetical protein